MSMPGGDHECYDSSLSLGRMYPDYTENASIFECPSAPHSWEVEWQMGNNYWYNSPCACFANAGFKAMGSNSSDPDYLIDCKVSKRGDPSRVVYCDGPDVEFLTEWVDDNAGLNGKGRENASKYWIDYVNHGKEGLNALYFDGHVETIEWNAPDGEYYWAPNEYILDNINDTDGDGDIDEDDDLEEVDGDVYSDQEQNLKFDCNVGNLEVIPDAPNAYWAGPDGQASGDPKTPLYDGDGNTRMPHPNGKGGGVCISWEEGQSRDTQGHKWTANMIPIYQNLTRYEYLPDWDISDLR
jgi:prepilin-type processing-associated H-X9-DG protein